MSWINRVLRAPQQVCGHVVQFRIQRLGGETEVSVDDDRDHAHIELLRLKQLSNEGAPSKTAIGTNHQKRRGVFWQVLI